MLNPERTFSGLSVALSIFLGAGLMETPATAEPIIATPTTDLSFDVRPNIVTADGIGTHVTTPGVPIMGLNHDGVAELRININSLESVRGTGSLLSTGRHVLTAAHGLTNSLAEINVASVTAYWHLSTGVVSDTSSNLTVHPLYNGSVTDGYDVAIIEFDTPITPDVPRYELFNGGSSELDRQTIKVGYGRSGSGDTGDTLENGVKRWGLNEWDVRGLDLFQEVNNGDTQLSYDFDNGLAAQDAFNVISGFGIAPDLGYGDDEVMAARGDSGGPSFIDENGVFQIAGVTSWGRRHALTDIDTFLNQSFGEFGVDARVADPEILSFIQANVPEPGSALLLIVGGALLLGPVRPQRA